VAYYPAERGSAALRKRAESRRTESARSIPVHTSARNEDTLSQCVTRSLRRYFRDLNGEEPTNLYALVMQEMERPLLEVVMQQVDRNQTRAAQILGINRNTLRKKLKQYRLG